MQAEDIIPVRYRGAVYEARVTTDRAGGLIIMFEAGAEFHMIPTGQLVPSLLSPAFDMAAE